MPVTITTRVDDWIAKLIDEIARREGMDRSTVMRRFLLKGIREWRIERALKEYEEGKITLWQAAEKCNLPLWEMIDEVKKRIIHVPYTLEDLKEDIEGIS
jgi:predicted HTH domain antitoxin